ncbi:MAG: hypothetical protein CfP315_0459 [Candidatus Improbicoccus pseudotrichonymphae]|uniref:Uncharacterized protein n=1 Tax=Candidatus Improbicoccus pseudotrichonymphae TaxID=3033792 RepID=A0AA48HY85_9FIRM|nr:MAG: hypothetical protein CfP315_0459 [Candidatus Improbicoccus pseudotrichonymphae]
MSKSRLVKKFLAILVFGFCNLNICAPAAIATQLTMESMETMDYFNSSRFQSTYNPKFQVIGMRGLQYIENQEYIKMKSLIGELAQESLTGNSMCDFVVLGKLFLETKEQLEETQNVNQAMENKIAELNANIRELQIKLDRLTQGIGPSQKEEEELKKLLAKKEEELKDYNSSRRFLIQNRGILANFPALMSPGKIVLASSESNINLSSTLKKIINMMSYANELSRENASLRNVIDELKQRERKLEDYNSSKALLIDELTQKEKELEDYNSSKALFTENDNRKILMDFLGATTQGSIFLATLASNINLSSTLRQIISGMLYAKSWIDELSRENASLRNVIDELKQRGEEKSDRGRFLLDVTSSSRRDTRLCDAYDTINDTAMAKRLQERYYNNIMI